MYIAVEKRKNNFKIIFKSSKELNEYIRMFKNLEEFNKYYFLDIA